MKLTLDQWLAITQAGGNAAYGELKPGDIFQWPRARAGHPDRAARFEKMRGGWYRPIHDHPAPPFVRFRTGSLTAVWKVEGA